jgi:hypothetical protein
MCNNSCWTREPDFSYTALLQCTKNAPKVRYTRTHDTEYVTAYTHAYAYIVTVFSCVIATTVEALVPTEYKCVQALRTEVLPKFVYSCSKYHHRRRRHRHHPHHPQNAAPINAVRRAQRDESLSDPSCKCTRDATTPSIRRAKVIVGAHF